MPLESAYFPLVADEFGYEHTVSIDFSDNVHTSTQTEELSKVQDNEDFATIHEIDSPLCIHDALIDAALADPSNCVHNFNVSDHAFTNEHTGLMAYDVADSIHDKDITTGSMKTCFEKYVVDTDGFVDEFTTEIFSEKPADVHNLVDEPLIENFGYELTNVDLDTDSIRILDMFMLRFLNFMVIVLIVLQNIQFLLVLQVKRYCHNHGS